MVRGFCSVLKHDKLIEEEHVECRPEKVSDAVVDENVDVCLVRKYFSDDAWMIVSDVVEHKKLKMLWKCNMCYHDLHSKPSIICDGCLLWFHFDCVSLTKVPKGSAGHAVGELHCLQKFKEYLNMYLISQCALFSMS